MVNELWSGNIEKFQSWFLKNISFLLTLFFALMGDYYFKAYLRRQWHLFRKPNIFYMCMYTERKFVLDLQPKRKSIYN